MPVIATAGHVDHGKSTLVHALTGIDPDRLEEEKRRGLTIDLGFAWLRLPSGREVGIVDVPGHERFIKNMLAGVGAINVTLFTVAANEGWKPQSQEHLDILDLLGVSAAVVAVTKKDAAEAERLKRVVEDVRARISETSLRSSAIVPVSALTGDGLNDLLKQIETVVDRSPPAEDLDRPRLWVDRVFSMKGSGTVVTGTLTGGDIVAGDEVEILPEGLRARIRSIQSHRKQVERIGPGNRTALNLVGVETESLARGDAISRPGLWRATDRVVARIRFLAHLDFEPSERGAFKLYAGSSERAAEIRFLDGPPPRGGEAFAAILLDHPVVLDWGDRFVLREAGRRATVGGGLVLEPHPGSIRRNDPRVREGAVRRAAASNRQEYFQALLEEVGSLARRDIRIRSGLHPEDTEAHTGVWLPSRVFSESRFEVCKQELVAALADHHSSHRLEAGMPRESVRARLDLDPRTFDEIVTELSRRGLIVADDNFLRTPEHSPALGGPEKEALMKELQEAGPSPPTLGELETRFDRAFIRGLVRAGDLVQINPDIVFAKTFLDGLKTKLAEYITKRGPVTVAQFRDLVGTTRKYAVPILEYLDQIGFTRRQEDTRILGPRA